MMDGNHVNTEIKIEGCQGIPVLAVGGADSHRPLSELLRRAGVPLNTRCGERGLCQACQVEVIEGDWYQGAERHLCHLLRNSGGGETSPRWVRSCELFVSPGNPLAVRIPTRALLAHGPQVVTNFRLNVSWTRDPLWQATGDQRAARSYGEQGWDVSVAAIPQNPLGAAVDIGTTTVVVALVELATGKIVGQTAALNGQTRLGDNVLTRINRCMNDPLAVGELQRAVIDHTLTPLLLAALREADAEAASVQAVTLAGNTTMLHLLAGVDPSPMGVSPFTPNFRHYRRVSTGDLGLRPWLGELGERPVHLLPSAAAYVGADIVAGVLATGMAYDSRPSLLIDLGTNGEIVLQRGQRFWGCSTAAGPAFEGTGLLCGVRAGEGAIAHIWFDDVARPRTEIIGGGKAIGLCGTAYLDFLARGRVAGVINRQGRLTLTADHPGLIRDPHHGRALVLDKASGQRPLVVSEADLSALLQAKAAIAAGVESLLRRAELSACEVETVYLAGGFGFHMHIDSLLGCGLLPGFDPHQIQLVGNSSLAGAYASLLDSSFLDELRGLADRIEIVELNLEPDFESLYIDHLCVP